MKEIVLPKDWNYIGVFLTFRCNLNCPYCINKQGESKPVPEMTAEKWIKGLSRIKTTNDLPVTLCGGEPTCHREFYTIASELHGEHHKAMDLLTNGKFNALEFLGNIDCEVFKRKAPYACIRFSHHKGLNEGYLKDKLNMLQSNGFSVGVWGLDCNDNTEMKNWCKENHIDYRIKEFLDETHGTYKYPEMVDGKPKKVLCKPSELLIGPSGNIYRCHANLYADRNPYAGT